MMKGSQRTDPQEDPRAREDLLVTALVRLVLRLTKQRGCWLSHR
jgi:hypothetical protein